MRHVASRQPHLVVNEGGMARVGGDPITHELVAIPVALRPLRHAHLADRGAPCDNRLQPPFLTLNVKKQRRFHHGPAQRRSFGENARSAEVRRKQRRGRHTSVTVDIACGQHLTVGGDRQADDRAAGLTLDDCLQRVQQRTGHGLCLHVIVTKFAAAAQFNSLITTYGSSEQSS